MQHIVLREEAKGNLTVHFDLLVCDGNSLPEWVIFVYFCSSILKLCSIETCRTHYRSRNACSN